MNPIVDSGLTQAIASGGSMGLQLLALRQREEEQAREDAFRRQQFADLSAWRRASLGLGQQRIDQGDARLGQGQQRLGIAQQLADQGADRIDQGQQRIDNSVEQFDLKQEQRANEIDGLRDVLAKSGLGTLANGLPESPTYLRSLAIKQGAQAIKDRHDEGVIDQIVARAINDPWIARNPELLGAIINTAAPGSDPKVVAKSVQKALMSSPSVRREAMAAAGVPEDQIGQALKAGAMHDAGVSGAAVQQITQPGQVNLSANRNLDINNANTMLRQAENKLHSLQNDWSGTVTPQQIEDARAEVNAAYQRKIAATTAAAQRPTAPSTTQPGAPNPAASSFLREQMGGPPTTPAPTPIITDDAADAVMRAFAAKFGRLPTSADLEELKRMALQGPGAR